MVPPHDRFYKTVKYLQLFFNLKYLAIKYKFD
jgi:hypothetical protein